MEQEEIEERSFNANEQLQVPSSGMKLPSVNTMKKSSTNNLLENSRTSNKDSKYGKDSRITNGNFHSKDQIVSGTGGNL